MMKYNRDIDEFKLNQTQMKTIDIVMNRIESRPKKITFFSKYRTLVLAFSLSIVVALTLIFATETPTPTPITLSEFSTEKIVETTYLSGSIIANSIRVANPLSLLGLSILADDDITEFEQNIDEFNQYFDMLKIFIDDSDFNQAVVIETLTEGEYSTKMTYSIDGNNFEFLLNINDNIIIGILSIDTITMNVTGEITETDNSLELDLTASNQDNFIEILYETETKDEVEKKYTIKQDINGVYSEKEVKVSYSQDEVEVQIHQGEDEYKLKKESSNGVTVYKLEYKINDLEGEAYITETLDIFGNATYTYNISEDGIEKEIDKADPDDDYDDEDEEDEDDEEDEEDEEDDEELEDEEDDEELEDEEDDIVDESMITASTIKIYL
ncbi:hypothetical protein RJI07_00080 [Mycoplasmatota bacterium WC30]